MELFHRCVENYKSGDNDFEGYYSEGDRSLLQEIGYKPRELFDFVEDFVDEGVPDPTTALLIASARRDYFQVMQQSEPSPVEITRNDLPSFSDELEGIPYLPRIIKKARAKLRGEMDPDLMFSCGGDRKFLREHGNIHPADFLRVVWSADDDDGRILKFVKQASS